jgi:hypothetical protein
MRLARCVRAQLIDALGNAWGGYTGGPLAARTFSIFF